MSDRLPALQIKNENCGIIDQKNLLNMIESFSKETLKSTERMLEYCNLSETAGVKTLMALDEQGEKLNRANDGLNLVENDLESVEYNLNKLEMGIFNCCCCCCVSRKDTGKRNFLFSCWMILKKKCLTCRKINSCSSINQSKSQTISLNSKSGSELSIKSFKSKLNVRKEHVEDKNEKQIAHNLEQLMYSLGNLNNLAQNVNKELAIQNRHIKEIGNHANLTVSHVHDADKFGRRLLNK
jgi:hypothetical protein